jgi:hypothetical protein
MDEERYLEPSHSKVEMEKVMQRKSKEDVLKDLFASQAYVKALQKKFGEYEPLIDKIDVKQEKSLILQILWMMIKSPIKTVRYIYYFVKLITGAKAMWETIKLMFTNNFKTTVGGIIVAVVVAIVDFWQTGTLFSEPVYALISILAIVVGIVMPDMGWLKKIIQELAESAKKKKDE